MTLDVQRFLETKTFGELETEWGVCARVSPHGHKFSLNYDMIAWTPGHRPSEQCRGLVLCLELGHGDAKVPVTANCKPDPSFCPGKTVVLAYPMDKFYNNEEGHAASLDWSDPALRVEDKLDGTLCILYWDHVLQGWCVSTRSVPDADLPVDGWPDRTFRKLFEDAVRETTALSYNVFCSLLPKSYTYCFELTGPYNRIMVEYKKPGITFLAARNLFDNREQDRQRLMKLNPALARVPLPKAWPLASVADVKAFVNEMPPTECEGAVVMDGEFRRVKIKSAKWLVANATKTSLGSSPRNLVRYILQGIDDDVQSLLPEDTQKSLTDVKRQIHELFIKCDSNFQTWKQQATSRKHFAEFVNLHEGWQGPYFRLYEGKVSSTWEHISSLLKSDKLSDAFIDGILRHVKVRPHEPNDQEAVSG